MKNATATSVTWCIQLCLLSHMVSCITNRSLGLNLRQENGESLDIISDGVILDPARANVQVEGGQQGNVIIKLPSYFYDGDTAAAH